MTDAEIKNLLARLALSGLTRGSALEREGFYIQDADVVSDGGKGGPSRSVQITLVGPDNWPRVFEFTVRELLK